MSVLTLRLLTPPADRLDMSGLTPAALAGLSDREISRFALGTAQNAPRLGDYFKVSGVPGETLVIETQSDRLDYIGFENSTGKVIVEGDAGAYAGRRMRGGRLEIRGNAGPFLASSLEDGIVTVAGSAGDNLGAPLRGDSEGLTGGAVIVNGDVGAAAGARMRRGTIIVNGRIGSAAGERMLGGTIWTASGFGTDAGIQMRRGTLIGPSVEQMRPTFVDCGLHELGILAIMNRYFAATLGEWAPRPISGPVRRFAGDMASIGRGEILLTNP
jgi:formylmethanofuran dehydrogenase subunit C